MRLVFAGTPAAAVPSLDALLKSRHEVAAVLTRPDAKAGRGLRVGQSPVAERAAEAGIEILRPSRPSDQEFLARLRAIAPGCCPVTAYGALIPQEALDIPARGWVNLHFSLLPAWRGAAPVQHAILHGDDVTGATTFQIVRALDAGPVYGVLTEPIRPSDTSGDLLERLSTSGAELLVATLDGIEAGEVEAREQPADGVSLAPKITPADAQIDWRAPAIAIDRQIRACTPDPGAWTQLDGVRVKLWPAKLAAGAADSPLAPGELRAQRDRVLAGTGSSAVELGEVQPDGKRRMRAADWARGLHFGGQPLPRLTWPGRHADQAARAAMVPAATVPAVTVPAVTVPPVTLAAVTGPAAAPADPARRVALDVLLAVAERDAYANLLLPQLIAQRHLSGRDAALATELTYGTLRGRGTYDAVLAICSDRDLDSLDPAVREVLRLGTHQLLATRIQPHAAVATSVNLVKATAGQRPAGFVNAILRRVATRDLAAWLDIAAPARDADPVGSLAVRYSHPGWVVEAFAAALGEVPGGALEQTEAALAAGSERPSVHLCVVPGLASQQELVTAGCAPARWSPYGAYLADGDPAAVGAVADGRAGVQDEASQLAAVALARVATGGVSVAAEHWLDLCAGPGGKARLLAGLAAGAGSRLLAAEVREHRARLVLAAVAPVRQDAPAGLTRQASPAGVIVADGTRPAWRLAGFDRVIADVPCSGLGALRRRPEARWRRTPDDVRALGGLQRDLLGTALDSARPGGVVAYVTCSPHLAETQAVVADVLAARADTEVLDAPAVLAEVPNLSTGPDGQYAQFWPHVHGTDAIFLALLRRT